MTKQYFNYTVFIFLLAFLSACSSTKDFSVYENVNGTLVESGIASWYGPNFNGRKTASGETFNMYELTAAHRTLPFNSILRVINRLNNKSVIVRINDRGPYLKERIIDLSKEAATRIDMIKNGSAEVNLFLLSEANLPLNIKVPHYTVQVGSYITKSDAVQNSSFIKDAKVVDAFVNGEKYYRIYVGFFENLNDAKQLKDSLQSKGINGFVKQIEN